MSENKGRVGYTRVIEWTETFKYNVAICFLPCDGCGIETPDPPREQVLEFAKNAINRNRHFMWPASDIDNGCLPAGWSFKGGDLYCPDCTKTVQDALDKRRLRLK